jgi:Na+-transporting NADH:ubiquinone oxidoreductase subunit C
MRSFSNKYIFIYITILVTTVAILLSLAAVTLKPLQDANREKERIEQILSAADCDLGGDILARYNQIAQTMRIPQEGKEDSLEIIRIITPTGQKNYIISLHGKGLWGPIWGYICIGNDGNTVKGAVFSHKGETPGLGAEIAKPEFSKTFIGKLLFDDKGKFVSVRVIKGGVANSAINPLHGVDAITGGTVTCNGVDKMLYDNLVKYVPFLKSLQPTSQKK